MLRHVDVDEHSHGVLLVATWHAVTPAHHRDGPKSKFFNFPYTLALAIIASAIQQFSISAHVYLQQRMRGAEALQNVCPKYGKRQGGAWLITGFQIH